MPRTTRAAADTLRLRVTSPSSATEQTMRLTVPVLPWPLAAGLGGAVAAAVGWLLLAGVVGVAWLTAIEIPLPDVLTLCSQLWLLAHGGPALVAGSPISLIPLGLTIGGALLCAATGRFAGGQARLARPALQRPSVRFGLAAQVAALGAVGYAGVAALMVLTLGGTDRNWQPVVGAFAVALVAGLIGAFRALGLTLDDLLPDWAVAGVRGGLAGALALVALGAVVVGLAMLTGAGRVAAIEDSLGLDIVGNFVWAFIALAYLPTMMVWGVSWALGGGFTVGTGSLVTLAGTKLGMLPAIPLLGALPPVGIAPPANIAWLATGVVAGAVAGALASRRRTSGRSLGATALAALLAGVLTSALLLLAAWAAIGSLGSLRLIDLGPRLAELVLVAPVTLVLSALAAAAVRWVVGTVRARGSASVG